VDWAAVAVPGWTLPQVAAVRAVDWTAVVPGCQTPRTLVRMFLSVAGMAAPAGAAARAATWSGTVGSTADDELGYLRDERGRGDLLDLGGELECVISTTTTASTNIQLQYTGGLNLVSGHNYRFTFDAYATADRALDTSIWENGHDLDNTASPGPPTSTLALPDHDKAAIHRGLHDAADEHRRGGSPSSLDGDAATVYIDDVALNELP